MSVLFIKTLVIILGQITLAGINHNFVLYFPNKLLAGDEEHIFVTYTKPKNKKNYKKPMKSSSL